MSPNRIRLRRRTFLVVAILAAACALLSYAFGLSHTLELTSVDARFALRGARPTPPDLAVVAVDDVTFSETHQQWPFPRSLDAKVIDRLTDDGAKVVAIDIQFTEQSKPKEDQALLASVDRNRPVVLATTETGPHGSTEVFGGDQVVRSVGARVGNGLLAPDRNAVLRTVPYEIGGLQSFAAVAAETAEGHPIAGSSFTGHGRSAWVNYAGPPGTILTVSFSRVLKGDFRRGTFRGRVVVVGATAPSLQDLHATSTTAAGNLMAGPEVQAEAIGTVLDGFPLKSPPGWVNVLLIIALSACVPLIAMRLRFRMVAICAVLIVLAVPLLAQLAFQLGLIVPLVAPATGLALAIVATTAGHALLSASDRQRIRELFGRFVPEAVVSEVLARTGDDLRIGGQRREGTVMFCDLRGFTTFAERLPPDGVIDVLNHYLSEMSDAIMGHEGTLVAFMGDGIMAVFGAPLVQPDHADRALAAAREMLDVRLPRFNAWLVEAGMAHEFRMGIGLNSGPVMSGNVGSRTRVEYTAIGDTTNTASRIESMTKVEQTQLLVADATLRALVDPALRAGLRSIGEREVRGRDEGIALWAMG